MKTLISMVMVLMLANHDYHRMEWWMTMDGNRFMGMCLEPHPM